MPTARELLEQADALMRRNRAAAIDDIPVLTDSVQLDEAPLPVRMKLFEQAAPARATPDPLPTRTERVDSSAKVAEGSMMGEGEPSDWLEFDDPQPSVMGDAPDSIAIVPPVELAQGPDDALLASAEHEEIELASAVEEDFDNELAQRAARLAVVDVAAPGLAAEVPALAARSQWDDQARWDAAAEEISMQVLQRIDLFTDTGLREQLGSRLKPIVDRASADLVATINQHVGELLRAYVAEAIEREIERWKEQH